MVKESTRAEHLLLSGLSGPVACPCRPPHSACVPRQQPEPPSLMLKEHLLFWPDLAFEVLHLWPCWPRTCPSCCPSYGP